MSIKKRSGPVRQLSLPQTSQRCLQKRSSVELNDRKFEKDNNNNNTAKKNSRGATPPKDPELGSLLISASSITKQNGDASNGQKKSRSKERSTNSAPRGRGRGRGTWAPPPRPLRLAWGERGQGQSQSQEGPNPGVQVVAERCKGLSRPQTAGPAVSRESALGYNRNTILYSRKQFAERIRQAWRDREFTRQNLEIYLASPGNLDDGVPEPRVSPRTGFKCTYDVLQGPCSTSPYSVLSSELRAPSGGRGSAESELDPTLAWDPELGANLITDSEDEDDRPTPFSEQRISGYSNGPEPEMYKAETHASTGSGTPSTDSSSFESADGTPPWANPQSQLPASTRRQNFRNACQKAIDKSAATPPPQSARSARRTPLSGGGGANPPRTPKSSSVAKRLWSVPSQSRSFESPSSSVASASSEPNTYRGYERNIKSAPPPKRRLKAVRRKLKPFYGNLSASDDDSGTKGGTLARRRTNSSNGPKEVETMISLLSPTDSETETDGPDPLALLQVNEPFPQSPSAVFHPSPPPPPPHNFFHNFTGSATTKNLELKSSREDIREIKPPPLLFLRKSPKPVSFRLLGPAAKPHSALYPCRRSDPPVFENGPRESVSHSIKIGSSNDRLELTYIGHDHKKLVRAKPTDSLSSRLDGESKENDRGNNGQDSQKLQSILIAEAAQVGEATEPSCQGKMTPLSVGASPADAAPPLATLQDDPDAGSTEPQFKTTKEKECWHLFRKMVDKGISVSFDTVLRGMLTPTEYRLRKASEDSFT